MHPLEQGRAIRRRAIHMGIAMVILGALFSVAPVPRFITSRVTRMHDVALAANRIPGDSGLRRGVATDVEDFSLIAVSVQTATADPIRVRVHDRDGWGDWFSLEVDSADTPDPNSPEALDAVTDLDDASKISEPLWVGHGDGYEVELPTDATDVVVHLARERDERVTIDAVESPAGAAPDAMPPIRPRSSWGARPPREPYDFSESFELAVVHHTVTGNSYSQADVPGILRSVQAFHMDTNGWNDIAYNFAVDRFGGMWEARGGGVTNPVIGGHSLGANPMTTGIVALGNLSTVAPTQAMVDAIGDLAGWKLFVHGVNPNGYYPYRITEDNGKYREGQIVVLPAISGHRDNNPTGCPGDYLYPRLPEIRARAAAKEAQLRRSRSLDAQFHELNPTRVMDSRPESRVGPFSTPWGPGEARFVQVAGRAGIPLDATAAVLNVTAVTPTRSTHVTVWPGGHSMPATSNLNVPMGDIRANLVTVELAADGRVSVANNDGSTHIVIDVVGWYGVDGAPGSRFNPIDPERILDTRTGPGRTGKFGPGETRNLEVNGFVGVPARARAVVLNVAGVKPTKATHVTVWPTGSPRPTASNLNLSVGDTRANLVVAKVGSDGSVSLYNNTGQVDLVVDVVGWFGPVGSGFTPMRPTRVWDSRSGPGAVGRLGGGAVREVRIVGASDVPASASAVIVNVTAVQPSAATHLTVWPRGLSKPATSNLNVPPGDIRANLVTVELGPNGSILVANNAGAVDVVVDVFGWYR